MAVCKQLTTKGRQFFALALYFFREAKKQGRRFRASRLLKAWKEEMENGLSIQLTWKGEKIYGDKEKI